MSPGSTNGAAAGARRRRGCTVLVVHPDASTRERLAQVVATPIDHLIHAPSCEQALYFVSARAVDLVVTGLDLPGMDGEALLQELRARGGPPVVALVDSAATSQRVAWLDAGGADCIDRDDDPAAVRARFAALLRQAGLDQAARRPQSSTSEGPATEHLG